MGGTNVGSTKESIMLLGRKAFVDRFERSPIPAATEGLIDNTTGTASATGTLVPNVNQAATDNNIATLARVMDSRLNQNLDWDVQGTAATAASITRFDRHGITLTTGATSGNQVILVPMTGRMLADGWSTERQCLARYFFQMGAAVTSMILKMGLALTNSLDAVTDANQVAIRYEAGVNNNKFALVSRAAGVSATIPEIGNGAVAAARNYELQIHLVAGRFAEFWLAEEGGDMNFVGGRRLPGVANYNALPVVDLFPLFGIQTAENAAKEVHLIECAFGELVADNRLS